MFPFRLPLLRFLFRISGVYWLATLYPVSPLSEGIAVALVYLDWRGMEAVDREGHLTTSHFCARTFQ